MNAKTTIATIVCTMLVCSTQVFGQGITTLICQGLQTNQIQITSQQSVQIKSYWDSVAAVSGNSGSLVRIQSGPNVIDMQANSLIQNSVQIISHTPDFMIAGPATISLVTSGTQNQAILTLDVEPAPFPPGRTITVGANSGNVQVTMEMSTDLVNWTPAVNGQVYTNCPDARFFRIKLQTNVSP